MKLIVNADDYGMTKGVNLGIIEAHKNGIVTSTTLMVTMPEVEHGLALSKDYPNLGIGLHLNCTLGKPLTDCKSLIKENFKQTFCIFLFNRFCRCFNNRCSFNYRLFCNTDRFKTSIEINDCS